MTRHVGERAANGLWRRLSRYSRLCFPYIAICNLLFLAVIAIAAGPAAAQDASDEPEPLTAFNYKMAGDQNRTRIVLRFDRRPEVNWFYLRGPHRLVVDLPETQFAVESEELVPRGMIGKVRYGKMDHGHSRMIFTVNGPFMLEDLDVLENENSPGYRLIVDMVSASETAFETAMRKRVDQAPDPDSGKAEQIRREHAEPERFTVALDPGHGGIDSGTHGVNGTLEKTITLTFARELEKHLEEADDYNVVLTRDADVFLRLDERVRIAREAGADLLISIHADSIRLRNFGGATVYTLSDKASDAEAAATAARENLSDTLAGLGQEEEEGEVTDILVDLIRRETQSFSIHFARTLIGELTDDVKLVNNPLRSAGFRVLRAPDVPSVLLELGYLSNPQDEEKMRDPEWRAEAAGNVLQAIEAFAALKAGAGG